MPRPLKIGMLGAGTIILSENIHKNAGKVTLIFADSHVILALVPLQKKLFAQGRVLALFSGNVTKVKISTF
jgi:hypothetical protein